MSRHLEAWRLAGSCATHPDPDMWFDDDPHAVASAKAVCAGCPVRATCLTDALARGEAFGVLGGLTGGERRGAAAAGGFPRPSPAGAAQHGHRGMYVAGCRCSACRAANTRYVAAWRATRPVTPRITVVVAVLHKPTGRGLHRAWPGQLYIEGIAA